METCYLCSLVAGHLATLVVSIFYVVLVKSRRLEGLICSEENLQADKQLRHTLCDITVGGAILVAGYNLLSIIILPCFVSYKPFQAIQVSICACALAFFASFTSFVLLCFLFWCDHLLDDSHSSSSCYRAAQMRDAETPGTYDTRSLFWTGAAQISAFLTLLVLDLILLLAYALRTKTPTWRGRGHIHLTSQRSRSPERNGSDSLEFSETTPLFQHRLPLASN